MSDVTQILSRIDAGDPSASEALLPLVYEELRKLAAARLANESPGQTLQTTALVHEAYLRLVSGERVPEWEGRRHFFGAAAEAMRRILVEQARRKQSIKHGGKLRRIDLDDQSFVDDERHRDELLALDEALTELARHDPRAAQVVNLRYFAGMSLNDIADVMQIGRRTADRLWALAKAWLYERLTEK
jgi:RNA polymerase sigma factor (TIGR02999 family)